MAEAIRFPRLGWSMEEGRFVQWLKNHGDAVRVGDLLFEVEGEKAIQQIESLDEGVLYLDARAPQPGDTVAVGALLGYVLGAGESVPIEIAEPNTSAAKPMASSGEHMGVQASVRGGPAGPSARRLAKTMNIDLSQVVGSGRSGRITTQDVALHAEANHNRIQSASSTQPSELDKTIRSEVASPRARRLARELQIDWRSVSGTGRDGRVRAEDILAASAHPSLRSGDSSGVRLSPRRRAIVDRLRRSLNATIPVTLTTVVDASNMLAIRRRFKDASANLVPSFHDIVAKAIASVLPKHSKLAVRWTEDGQSLVSSISPSIDIGLAVDTEDGLLVPMLGAIERKSLIEIAQTSKLMINKARAGRLSVAEMQGGAMTISNLGAYGVDAFTPIIPYPQIAILGLGTVRKEPVYDEQGDVVARDRMVLSFTFDHAAVDGAPAAAFLQAVVRELESLSVSPKE